jgi:ribosomal-protein-alanine N-acetyltransferase
VYERLTNIELSPYVVERMAPKDVPAVAVMEKLVFAMPWSARAFEYELQHNAMAHFVVVREKPAAVTEDGLRAHWWGGRKLPPQQPVLGYAGLWLIVDEGHVCTLAVHPDWRGRRLGELLLVTLIERSFSLNASVVTLEVRASNLVAQQLYRKYGFAVVGLRKGYYSDNHEDALIMTTDPISTASYQSLFQELRGHLATALSEQLTVKAC